MNINAKREEAEREYSSWNKRDEKKKTGKGKIKVNKKSSEEMKQRNGKQKKKNSSNDK